MMYRFFNIGTTDHNDVPIFQYRDLFPPEYQGLRNPREHGSAAPRNKSQTTEKKIEEYFKKKEKKSPEKEKGAQNADFGPYYG